MLERTCISSCVDRLPWPSHRYCLVRLIAFAALGLSVSGCWKGGDVFKVKYSLQYDVVVPTNQANENTLVAGAAERINSATTLAFVAPDRCRNTGVETGLRAQSSENLIGLDCGDIMSTLENAATKAGFSVVSWQMLRRSDWLEYSKSVNVDLLIEVNDFRTDAILLGTVTAADMHFYEYDEGSYPPITITDGQTIKRCKDTLQGIVDARHVNQHQSGYVTTLSAKMVDVQVGTVLWFYATSEEYRPPAEEQIIQQYFMTARQDTGVLQLLLGVALTLSGVGGVAIGDTLTAALGLGLGGVDLIWGTVLAVWPTETAEEVVCLESREVPDPALWSGDEPPVESEATSTKVVFTTSGGSDADREQQRAIEQKVLERFATDLSTLRMPR